MSGMSETQNLVAPADEIDLVVVPRIFERVKGFKLRRVLSNIPYLSVGPFVLFDHFGPVTFGAGSGLDAPPHPHVGMATLTYLFEGELVHRDSMGNTQGLRPGEANWMIAGRGAAHSERTPAELRQRESRLAGAQLWLALPRVHEDDAPSFEHHAAAELPVAEREGTRIRVVAGTFDGMRSPVGILSPTLCADIEMQAGAQFVFPLEHDERAAYVVSGDISVSGESFAAARMPVFRPGKDVLIKALTPARLLLLGGTRMDEPRHKWSTVVSSSRERLEWAKAEWNEGRIPSVKGETERGNFPPM